MGKASEKAKLREKLFGDCSRRFVAAGGKADTFQCPLCTTLFTRDALASEPAVLTLAHVLPEALGGTFCTLACGACNNDIGSDLEAFLVERFRAEDAMQGVGNLLGRLEGDFGSVGVEFRAAPAGEPWTVLLIEKQTNPAVIDKLNSALDANSPDDPAKIAVRITPRYRNKPSRVSAALYQSAYLMMFAYFGYDVVRDPRYAKLREQICKPDEDILPAEFNMPPEAWADAMLPKDHGIMMVKEPASFIMPVFRLRPKDGLSRVIGVPLPGLDDTAWPACPKGRVKGVIARVHPSKDGEEGLRLGDFWELAKRMP